MIIKWNIQKKNHKELIRNNKSILKTHQRFETERDNVFTEEINKIALSLNDDEWIKSFDSIETHANWISKYLVSEKKQKT